MSPCHIPPLNLDAASFTSSRSGWVGPSKSRALQSRHSLPFSAPTLIDCQRCRPREQRTTLHGLRMQRTIPTLSSGHGCSTALSTNGSDLCRLTSRPRYDGNAHYAPDGRSIGLDSDMTGNVDVFVMRDSGASVRQLTNDPAVTCPDAGQRRAGGESDPDTDPSRVRTGLAVLAAGSRRLAERERPPLRPAPADVRSAALIDRNCPGCWRFV